MSHVVTVEGVEFKDLEAVKRACKRLGWQFQEGQKTFAWFNAWVGDTAAPLAFFTPEERVQFEGMTYKEQCAWLTEVFGKCDHAIKVPGCNYEIGIVEKGNQFHLLWDYYSPGGLDAVLGGYDASIINPFPQAYAIEKIKLDAEANGWTWQEEKLKNGKVQVKVNNWGS